MQELQSEAREPWRQYIQPAEEFRPWRKQAELWAIAAVAGADWKALAILTTGYGKTIAALGAYLIRREKRIVNRMLVLVPTDQQRTQWVAHAITGTATLGGKIGRVEAVTKEPWNLRDDVELWVATYQQLTDPEFWNELLMHNDWFLVPDECHHLAEEGVWGPAVQSLRAKERLLLTATPFRTDRQLVAGMPGRVCEDGKFEPDHTVKVTYEAALKERAVRAFQVNLYHYDIEVERGDGERLTLTTEKLRNEGITTLKGFAEWEAKQQLRYRPSFVSPMLEGAVTALYERDIVAPSENQMLVFAMTCRHAQAVCGMLNASEGSGFADWIGVARPAVENKRALERFMANKLRCLVNVDKAGEGFDNKRCCVLVFLHLVNSETRIVQQLGRGCRRNPALSFMSDVCVVIVSADSPVAKVALSMECQSNGKKPVRHEGDGNDDGRLGHIPEWTVVNSELDRIEVLGETNRAAGYEVREARAWLVDALKRRGSDLSLVDSLPLEALAAIGAKLGAVPANGTGHAARTTAKLVADSHKTERERVDSAVKICARAACIRKDGHVESARIGVFIQAVHTEWIRQGGLRAKDMTTAEMRRKHEWVRQIHEALKRTGEVPLWFA